MPSTAPDFLTTLQGHSLLGFGQRRPGGILATPAAHTSLGSAVRPPAGWTGDDWVHDVSLLSETWPRLLRDLLQLPLCIDTASLLVYLAADAAFFLLWLQVVRRTIRRLDPDFADAVPRQGQPIRNWFAGNQRLLVVLPITCVLVSLSDDVLFRLLSWRLGWVRKPPLLLTLAILLYGSTVRWLGNTASQ